MPPARIRKQTGFGPVTFHSTVPGILHLQLSKIVSMLSGHYASQLYQKHKRVIDPKPKSGGSRSLTTTIFRPGSLSVGPLSNIMICSTS